MALVAILSTVVGAEARARPSDDLVKQGLDQRRKGNDQEALELFRRAQELDPAPRNLAQMGLAEQALGSWSDAEAHLKGALKRGDDPWIRKNQVVLRTSLDAVAQHLGSLAVWGSPVGADVIVNGVAAGVLPLPGPLRVTAGSVSVTVRAKGFVGLSRVVAVAAGSVGRERFDLPRDVLAASTAVARSAAAPSETESMPMLRARPEPAEEPPATRPVWKRWWFWTAIGAAAIAGGATAFVLLRPGSPTVCDGRKGPCTGI
ncbi:MAG TPA: hypothetical protein VFH68_21975 [Polyangia bacterium]|nr:hypothetical protein [Polyangia bacterium]